MSISAKFIGQNHRPAPAGNLTAANSSGVPSSVAIIVPCHNYARYLADCLTSILGQSAPPAEIVVVDDASTDETAAVAAEFAARGVRYLRVAVRNPHEARKAGLEDTDAPLVCFVDADDQLSHEYLRNAIPLFKDATVAIAYSPIQEFAGSTKSWNPTPGNINRCNWIHAGAVVRRAAIERSQAFEMPNEAIREDYEVWRRILNDGWKSARNPMPYLYRRHADSRSSLVPPRTDKVVVSCYWTLHPDPQRSEHQKPNCWRKVAPWALGLQKQGLRGVILHDDLSAEFVAQCAQYGVECIKLPAAPDGLGNCARWFSYRDWLRESEVETAFFTDLFDVQVNGDAFSLLRLDYDLWVGNEPQMIGESRWMLDALNRSYGEQWPEWLKEKQILNCGIVGGFREPLLQLFERMCAHVATAKTEGRLILNDMPFFNRVLYCETDMNRVWAKGAPLHSVFKAYDYEAPVAFVHK